MLFFFTLLIMSLTSKYPCRYIKINNTDTFIDKDKYKYTKDVSKVVNSIYDMNNAKYYSVIIPENVCLYFEYVEKYDVNCINTNTYGTSSTDTYAMINERITNNNNYNAWNNTILNSYLGLDRFIIEFTNFIKQCVPAFEYNGKYYYYTEAINIPFVGKVYPKYDENIIYGYTDNKNKKIIYRIVFPYIYMKTLKEVKTLVNMFLYYHSYHKQYLNMEIYEKDYMWLLPEQHKKYVFYIHQGNNKDLPTNIKKDNYVINYRDFYQQDNNQTYMGLLENNVDNNTKINCIKFYNNTDTFNYFDNYYADFWTANKNCEEFFTKSCALCMVNFIDSVALCIKINWTKEQLLYIDCYEEEEENFIEEEDEEEIIEQEQTEELITRIDTGINTEPLTKKECLDMLWKYVILYYIQILINFIKKLYNK